MGIKQMFAGTTDAPRVWLEGDDPEVAKNNALWRRQTAQRRLDRLDRDRVTIAAEIAEEDAHVARYDALIAEGPPPVQSHVARVAQLVVELESLGGYADRAAVAHSAIIASDAIERTASAIKSLNLTSVDADLRRLRERVEKARTAVGLSAA